MSVVSFRAPLHLFSNTEQATYQIYEPRISVVHFEFCNGCLVRMVHTTCSNVVKTNYLLLLHLSGYVVSHFTVPVKMEEILMWKWIQLHRCLKKNFSMNYGVCLYVIL